MSTSFEPPMGPPMIDATPPMWNSGPAASDAGCTGGAGSRADSTASRALANAMFQRLAMALRLVPSAPLGRPVVPEV
jgi:hypothetical protein